MSSLDSWVKSSVLVCSVATITTVQCIQGRHLAGGGLGRLRIPPRIYDVGFSL